MARSETAKRRAGKPAPAILAVPDAEVPPTPLTLPTAMTSTLAIDAIVVPPPPVDDGADVDAIDSAVEQTEAQHEPQPEPEPLGTEIVAAEPEPEPAADEVAAPAPDVAPSAAAVPPIAAEAVPEFTQDVVEPTASAVAEPIRKGLSIMATTFDTTAVADKGKAMFGEMNDRAKSAMEKSVKLGEEMTEFTKGNVEALVASSRVAAKGAETMAQDVAETMKKNFESATATLKSFAAVKSPTELFQLQSDYAKSYFDGAVADASRFSEAMMKLVGDIAQPLSSRYALAAEKIKVAAL